jgi:cellobiose phosphorylase
MRPEIPDEWSTGEIIFRFRSSVYRISLERVSTGRTCRIECDGKRVENDVLKLRDDGTEHRVVVRIGVDDDSASQDRPDPTVRAFS